MINFTHPVVPLVLKHGDNTLEVYSHSITLNLVTISPCREDYEKLYNFLIQFFNKARSLYVEYPFATGSILFADGGLFLDNKPVSPALSGFDDAMKGVVNGLCIYANRLEASRSQKAS